jgi:hypothetical protein
VALTGNTRGKGVFSTSTIWRQLSRESKRSQIFEIALVLVRFNHVA